MEINGERLLERIHALGRIGRDTEGKLSRVALTDADREARDQVVAWFEESNLKVSVDGIGNIFGTWAGEPGSRPVMIGSHIDSVIDAGQYDGSYGVLAGLEVLETLRESGIPTVRPLSVAAFTNEEGVRYAPDMMGSLVHAGGLPLESALAIKGNDGTVLGEELERIGYLGSMKPGEIVPEAFLELHIEQGPVLESEGITIGAVENLQGISWQRITISGKANHAGTTPTRLRVDAGLAAARVNTYLRDHAEKSGGTTVATMGTISFSPNAINVIPASATFTVDIRDPDEQRLRDSETSLGLYLDDLRQADGLGIEIERLARFEPVEFDSGLVQMIESACYERDLPCMRMTSGAGHDAQMMARICPAAMIFVPSRDGISHNPAEHTEPDDLVAGTNILLDVTRSLVTK